MNYKTVWNSLVAFFGTWTTYLLGGWDSILKILAILMAVDYITELMKGFKNKNLASDIGFNGLMKKVLYS
nr:phage holin family protein [Alkaliphilus flagellatus]